MKSNKKIIRYLLIIIPIVICFVLIFVFTNRKQNKDTKDTATTAVETVGLSDNDKKIVEKASKLIEMPTNETPVIATVVDKTKNENDEFLKAADNGDLIIIFPNNNMRFIYRESSNQIIAHTNAGK